MMPMQRALSLALAHQELFSNIARLYSSVLQRALRKTRIQENLCCPVSAAVVVRVIDEAWDACRFGQTRCCRSRDHSKVCWAGQVVRKDPGMSVLVAKAKDVAAH